MNIHHLFYRKEFLWTAVKFNSKKYFSLSKNKIDIKKFSQSDYKICLRLISKMSNLIVFVMLQGKLLQIQGPTWV